MIHAGDAAARALGEADPGACNLAARGALLELPDELDHLCDSGGTQRMAFGQQPSRRVHCNPPTNLGRSREKQVSAFARLCES
jgi:hypothetical protein